MLTYAVSEFTYGGPPREAFDETQWGQARRHGGDRSDFEVFRLIALCLDRRTVGSGRPVVRAAVGTGQILKFPDKCAVFGTGERSEVDGCCAERVERVPAAI
jgi:hypothetical protein